MSKILANHPRLSKFVFGLFGAAGMIWLNKAFQGDELFQLITSLLALDTFVYFCIYSLINPIPEANDFLWDYKVHHRKYSSNISHNDFVSNVRNSRKIVRILILVGITFINVIALLTKLKM